MPFWNHTTEGTVQTGTGALYICADSGAGWAGAEPHIGSKEPYLDFAPASEDELKLGRGQGRVEWKQGGGVLGRRQIRPGKVQDWSWQHKPYSVYPNPHPWPELPIMI